MIAKSGRRLIHTMLRESSMPRIEGHLNVETESLLRYFFWRGSSSPTK